MDNWFAATVEPRPAPDWADATRAAVHDPVWFLTRQWQLGELQGENASTPVAVAVRTAERPLRGPGPGHDLAAVPPEVLVESEADDWWTPGRRLRVGRAIATALGLDPRPRWLIADPPPPYDAVSPAWDGLALWRDPDLVVDPALLPEVPPEPVPAWVPDRLVYEREDAFAGDGVRLHLRRHRGGRLDWFGFDADDLGAGAPGAAGPARTVVPARLDYPGMPRSGVWEIEDADADIGALAPDATHTATAIMTALFAAHRDEWFDAPVPTDAGNLVRIVEFTVTDSFGDRWQGSVAPDGTPAGAPGLAPPADPVRTPFGDLPWGLFHTRGLPSGELVLWQAVDRPLEGEVLERVQFGVDDESNVVWAVERRLEQRDVPSSGAGAGALDPALPPPGDTTRGQAYRYVGNQGATAGWIPYTMPDRPDRPDQDQRALTRRRLVDLSGPDPHDLPAARAAVLRDAPALPESVIPLAGLQVERRWMLARGADGAPHLWVQRQRGPLMAPPARTLRFDLAVPTDA